MKKIDIVQIDKEEVHNLPEENILGIFLPVSDHSSASVGIIEPGKTQAKHYHNRVDDGVEIVFVYQGSFAICNETTVSDVYDTDLNGPIFIQIPTKTIAYLKNTGKNPVKFFSVFAPSLKIEELIFLAN